MDKAILISVESQERRVAVVENKVLEEFYVERTGSEQLVGSIFKGKVSSVIPGIGAAFVDIGLPKNGFLYVSDIVKHLEGDEAELDEEADEPNHRKGAEERHRRSRRDSHRIEQLLKVGDDVLVQVVKEPLSTKGARLTSHVSLPGRYLVFMPTDHRVGVSKRIADPTERSRLRAILKELQGGKDFGLIVRTVGSGTDKKEFARDVRYLTHLWQKIHRKAKSVKAPNGVYHEYDLVLRMIRDSLTDDVTRMVVDSPEEFRRISHFISMIVPQLRSKLTLYRGEVPLFEKEGIEEEIARLYDRKVTLKSGGYLIIEPTEGLVVIDVNTGRFTGRRNLEDTAFQTNVESAQEIGRQLRLRDLGGIITIDFIDMESHAHRREVFATLERALKRDRAKTNIVSFSELCLVEMTRQRMRRSMESVSYQPCPYCEGRGLVKSAVTVAIGALRQVKRYFQENRQREIELFVHPQVAGQLLKENRASLASLEHKFRARILVMSDQSMHMEGVRIQGA
ncbi:MAG: Rne/Rng family ribonuclease [Candidatus Omnitrophica bacterium]|nr:Rne/Rng family ribonuclease [Candidatus Omnitrophota bacterium]